jgi:TolB-like protein/tetratricopeptide (TPR) repeat protein
VANLFLSYAREDTAKLRPLATALERAGHSVWWDQHIPGGDEYSDAIERALDSAEAVIVAWTRASVRSAWVRDEAASGRDHGRLIPVTFDGCEPPIGFRQYQTIDLSRWNGRPNAKSIEQLTKAIEAKGSTSEIGDRAPPSASVSKPIGRASLFSRSSMVGAGLVLVLALAALLFERPPWHGAGSIVPKVALGQFTALSGDSAELGQALSNEILAAFGSEHEVSVITAGPGRASAPFVLDGTAQKTADAMHFTINLKNVHTGSLLWSQSYDRASFDTLAPRQVAVSASQVVRCGLWGAAGDKKPMSDGGLSLYLQWCNEYWGGSPDEDRILDAARRVTAALPDFSFGWSALALATVPISHRADSASAAQIGREGWAAAEKATRLNKVNPEGYMAEAGLLPVNRFADRERLLTRAISVRATECGCERQSYGDFLVSVGRFDEAAQEYDRARAMMPLAPMSNVRLAQALYLSGNRPDADGVINHTLQLWPDAETLRVLQVKSAFWTHGYAAAAPLLKTPELHLPDAERQALADAVAALQSNDLPAKQRAMSELAELAANSSRNDRLVVTALAALGAGDQALAAADSLIRERGPALSDVLFDPNLAQMRGSPAYAQLLGRLGLLEYWRSGGKLPDLCRGANAPSFCKHGKVNR